MGILSTLADALTSSANSAGDTGKDLACLVCGDGPSPSPRVYPGAVSSGAGNSGRGDEGLDEFIQDIKELVELFGKAAVSVADLHQQGSNIDLDQETATGGFNPDGTPDVNPFSFGMRDELGDVIGEVAERTTGTDKITFGVGIALDSAKVMHDIGRLKPRLERHRVDQDSKGIDVIAQERAKANPTRDAD